MARSINVSVNSARLDALAVALGEITEEQLGRAALRAVNEVADRTYDLARKRMNAGINLEDQYISRKLRREPAIEPSRPRATITAAGDLTILGRYNPKVILRPTKKLGKGDSSRGVPAGLKASGVSIEVTRGAPKDITTGFLMKLRGGNGMGVFTRGVDGKARHRYGPAVYQLFRHSVDEIKDIVADDLAETAGATMALEIRKAFK